MKYKELKQHIESMDSGEFCDIIMNSHHYETISDIVLRTNECAKHITKHKNRTLEEDMKDELLSEAKRHFTLSELEGRLGTKNNLI